MSINQPDPVTARRLTVARSQLLLNHGFFGALAMRLDMVELDTPGNPTLAVDGKHIFYNPRYVATLSNELLCTALAHEVMHCVFDHIGRRNGRDAKRWNHANDYVVNDILKDAGLPLSPSWLWNANYKGMTSDAIYNMLPPDPEGDAQDNCMDGVCDDPAMGGSSPTSPPSEVDVMEWKVAATQAAEAEKARGKLPGALERFMDAIHQPKIDWREQLREFMTGRARDDYSWAVPNRRMLALGVYMPGRFSENMGPIVIGVDTSGSIDNATLQLFGSQIKGISDGARPREIHIVYCDAKVQHVNVFGPDDDITFKLHGGGGTAFKPVFDYVEEKKIQPECLVYLTDMYGPLNFKAPDYPTLWASITPSIEGQFGQTIYVEP